MIVKSSPARRISACPRGMKYSSCGTSPLQQPFGVVGRGWHDNFQTGHVGDPGFGALRMMQRRAHARPEGHAKNNRHGRFPGIGITHLGGRVGNMVHGQGQKIRKHDLGDGAHPPEGGPYGQPGDGRFRDRRVDHPVWSETAEQPVGGPERTAFSIPDADIFPDDEDPFIPGHFFMQGFIDCFHKCQFSHFPSPVLIKVPASRAWRSLSWAREEKISAFAVNRRKRPKAYPREKAEGSTRRSERPPRSLRSRSGRPP
jgi:hypothetical protein